MKIHSIIIFKKASDVTVFNASYNVTDVSIFYRRNAKEMLLFMSKTVALRIQNQKICVTEKEYNIYAFDNTNYAVVAIADKEYPNRVAFSMIDSILNEINDKIDLDEILQKYQNPNEADKILKIKQSIESAKIVMLDTIEKVLMRNEKIDELVGKSQELSADSKIFYKETKKMNSWCGGCIIQ